MAELSLYFHVPFCLRRCGYCDFNTYAGMNQFIPDYVDALCQEIRSVVENAPETIVAKTIFFGGGTPSLIPIEELKKVLDILRDSMNFSTGMEISLEANPGTVSQDYLHSLRQIGFSRLSFGMQSAVLADLEILDRQHRPKDVLNAVEWSRAAGFDHINLDLIFGIPGQTRESWINSLANALGFGVDHYSLYSLTIEEGTPLQKRVISGSVLPVEEDVVAGMYEDAMRLMESKGYQQYEISNWSKGEDSRCRHNLQYWRYQPWLGFGAGAHGYYGKVRTENLQSIPSYIQAVKNGAKKDFPAGPALLNLVELSTWELIQENMMMSLRLTEEGVSLSAFQARYQVDLIDLFCQQVELLVRKGLLEFVEDGKRIRLTRTGRLLGNQVFSRFLDGRPPKEFEFLTI